MSCDYTDFTRLAHLEYIPLLGGEKALHDIRRLAFAVDSANGKDAPYVTEREAEVFSKMKKNSPLTSSFGRFLDTLAYELGVCSERTYDGEPAMKMEPLLVRGKRIEGFETETTNGSIGTVHLFRDIGKYDRCDAAYSAVDCVIERMVEIATDSASSQGIREIGLTGGVSYSIPISNMFAYHVRKSGFEPVFHRRVPNGDGGISVGQAAIALRRIQ